MAGIILPQLADPIGARQVRRYALSGERFGAHEARRIGLVHEVVPLAQLQASGEKIIEQLLQNAPEALEFAWGAIGEAVLERLVVQHAAKRRSREAARARFVQRKEACTLVGRCITARDRGSRACARWRPRPKGAASLP